MSSGATRLAEARTSSVKDERNVQLFSEGTQTGNNCKRVINLGDFNVLDAKYKNSVSETGTSDWEKRLKRYWIIFCHVYFPKRNLGDGAHANQTSPSPPR